MQWLGLVWGTEGTPTTPKKPHSETGAAVCLSPNLGCRSQPLPWLSPTPPAPAPTGGEGMGGNPTPRGWRRWGGGRGQGYNQAGGEEYHWGGWTAAGRRGGGGGGTAEGGGPAGGGVVQPRGGGTAHGAAGGAFKSRRRPPSVGAASRAELNGAEGSRAQRSRAIRPPGPPVPCACRACPSPSCWRPSPSAPRAPPAPRSAWRCWAPAASARAVSAGEAWGCPSVRPFLCLSVPPPPSLARPSRLTRPLLCFSDDRAVPDEAVHRGLRAQHR